MSVRFIPHQSFFDAVKSGHLKYVKDSLENDGSDSNYPSASTSSVMELRNDKGETCLYVAAESNQEEVFSYLLKYCDVDVVKIKSAKTGLDAFHVAAKNGHLGISPLLSMYIYSTSFYIIKRTRTSPLSLIRFKPSTSCKRICTFCIDVSNYVLLPLYGIAS